MEVVLFYLLACSTQAGDDNDATTAIAVTITVVADIASVTARYGYFVG